MIEAAEQRFESRPSIRLLSHLILNAWPGMIPFNMSMYAMLGFPFSICSTVSVRHSTVTYFQINKGIVDWVAIRHFLFLF